MFWKLVAVWRKCRWERSVRRNDGWANRYLDRYLDARARANGNIR